LQSGRSNDGIPVDDLDKPHVDQGAQIVWGHRANLRRFEARACGVSSAPRVGPPSQPSNHEQSQELLQQFLQWRKKCQRHRNISIVGPIAMLERSSPISTFASIVHFIDDEIIGRLKLREHAG
jgi:hypothetical protein